MSEDALQTLLAKQECFELSCRYNRGLDRLDAELLSSVFINYSLVKSKADILY